jgi:hypothetical protein
VCSRIARTTQRTTTPTPPKKKEKKRKTFIFTIDPWQNKIPRDNPDA